jgi:RNA polymerase sigma factor (sigma-70 family)
MVSAIELVHQYQRSKDDKERLQLADEIVVLITPSMELFIRLRTPQDIVEDVLQETLVAIAFGLDAFKGDSDGQFYGFCYLICWRRIVDALRKRGKIRQHELTGEELWDVISNMAADSPLSEAEREQLREALELLAEVRPPCVDYLLAHYIAGLTFDQISAVFDFPSEAAAGVATRRCLKLARELLEE